MKRRGFEGEALKEKHKKTYNYLFVYTNRMKIWYDIQNFL